MPIDALSVFCAQLTRDLLAIAKFLFQVQSEITYFLSHLTVKKLETAQNAKDGGCLIWWK